MHIHVHTCVHVFKYVIVQNCSLNLTYTQVEDLPRTIGLNTHYVSTTNFKMEPADTEFLERVLHVYACSNIYSCMYLTVRLDL